MPDSAEDSLAAIRQQRDDDAGGPGSDPSESSTHHIKRHSSCEPGESSHLRFVSHAPFPHIRPDRHGSRAVPPARRIAAM